MGLGQDVAQLQSLRVGRLTILSNHPVLDQVARDIAAGVDPLALPDRDIRLFVGSHRKFHTALFGPGLRIGLQTEHFFDDAGAAMWRRQRRWRTLQQVLRFHVVLDLSPANRPLYTWLPAALQRRVVFGAHIFPSHPVAAQPGQHPWFVFYGEVNARRASVLASLTPGTCAVLPKGTYGPGLDAAIKASAGVANVHFNDGTYTEYPRLLSAYLAGKPFVSETLGAGLVAGQDYGCLGTPIGPQDADRIFATFRDGFAARHRLTDLLRKLAR